MNARGVGKRPKVSGDQLEDSLWPRLIGQAPLGSLVGPKCRSRFSGRGRTDLTASRSVSLSMPDHNKSGALRPGTMKKIIQVRIFQGENQYVAECLDLPVVTQAKTLDELTENLREAISLHLKLMFFTRP